MSLIQAVVLAVVQGLTEFLPVSSSGHLVLTSWVFNWPDQGLLFDAAVHLGTLAAVLIYFRKTWITIIRGFFTGGDVLLLEDEDEGSRMPARKMVWLVLLGTIPVGISGLLLQKDLETSLRKPEWVALSLLGTAVILTLAEFVGRRSRRLAEAGLKDSAFAGLFQAVAVLPGVSRSGSTIAGGMLNNLNRDAAARFSFLLAVPAIGGSAVTLILEIISKEGFSDRPWGLILIGVAISFATGYVAISWFMKILQTRTFIPFIIYVAILGTAILVARALGAPA